MRILAMLALSVALGGCFSSEHPLYTEDRGQCPFASATTLEEIGENAERYTLAASGGYCQSTDANGRVSRALFVPIGAQWWIVQDDDEHPSYALIHREGSRLIEFLPKCEEFSPLRLRQLGVTFDEGQRECTANDARQIDTLFGSWRYRFFPKPVGALRIVATAPAP